MAIFQAEMNRAEVRNQLEGLEGQDGPIKWDNSSLHDASSATFEFWSGAKRGNLLARSRKMLQIQLSLTKIGFYTAENGPPQIWGTIANQPTPEPLGNVGDTGIRHAFRFAAILRFLRSKKSSIAVAT